MGHLKKAALSFLAAATILGACSQEVEEEATDSEDSSEEKVEKQEYLQPFEGNLGHVHGLGYIEEGFTFAAHTGIKIYQEGEWKEAVFHPHDYMGFQVREDGFLSSGHPVPSSDLQNPLGLQKGKVSEESLESLAFVGESDFHVMGAGFANEFVYVFNEQPNSQLDQGFYRSTDLGATWESISAEGIEGGVFQMAVHPTNGDTVAIATDSGVFLSENGGQSFERISESGQAGGLYFTEDELFYGLYNGEATMTSYLIGESGTSDVPLPDLTEDAVMYFAEKDNRIAIYTFNGAAYISEDGGENWEKVVEKGETVS
ncbi:F510_1955 family glycosylhydrolase [Halobacillus faecis]